ncbi:MAG: hypothetical protein RL014_2 [Pseudomonadota bacterium]|jgi:hypothetical protein
MARLIDRFVICLAQASVAVIVSAGSVVKPVYASDSSERVIIKEEEFSLAAARLFPSLGDGRYGAIELVSVNKFRDPGGKTDFRLAQLQIFSIDCANRGVELIRTLFNIETSSDKPPQWAEATSGQKYKDGFNPKDIQHTPVDQFLIDRKRELLTSISNEEHRRVLAAPSFSRADEEVAVDYACAVIKSGIAEPVARKISLETAWLNNIRSLICSLDAPNSQKGNDIELVVRFHESTGNVQVSNTWLKERDVVSDRISAKFRGMNLSISRISGRATLSRGDVRFSGSCERVGETAKF